MNFHLALCDMFRCCAEEDINSCFKTLPLRQVIRSDCVPALRLLIEVEATANLHYPAIVEPDLAVVKVLVELHVEHDVYLK